MAVGTLKNTEAATGSALQGYTKGLYLLTSYVALDCDFDWYHGCISRDEANKFLQGRKEGLFLIRKRKDPNSQYVLSVSEINKVSHYIILDVNGMYFKIGEQRFADIPSIIEFYKKNNLDTTPLTQPVLRPGSEGRQELRRQSSTQEYLKVRAKFNFNGNDPEDLPFKKGDILLVIRKEEEKWWLAKDNTGREGMIPVPYIEVIHSTHSSSKTNSPKHSPKQARLVTNFNKNYAKPKEFSQMFNHPQIPANHKGPLLAIAIQNREPNFYDDSMLGFKKGDKIEVMKAHDNGSWEGRHMTTGRTGYFPFNHVRLLIDS